MGDCNAKIKRRIEDVAGQHSLLETTGLNRDFANLQKPRTLSKVVYIFLTEIYTKERGESWA